MKTWRNGGLTNSNDKFYTADLSTIRSIASIFNLFNTSVTSSNDPFFAKTGIFGSFANIGLLCFNGDLSIMGVVAIDRI